jgi:hypothetical protein
MSKLTEAQVRQILTSTVAAKELAMLFSVSVSAIYKIREGVRWTHTRT